MSMRGNAIGGLATAGIAVGALGATACTSGTTTTTQQGSPTAPYDDGHAPPAAARPYTSCLTVLHLLNAKVWADGPVPGAPNATEADGNMPDGTQVQCHLGPPTIPGYYPPQTAYGNGWQVDVFGATTTATVAAKLGGQVGTS